MEFYTKDTQAILQKLGHIEAVLWDIREILQEVRRDR